MKKLKVLVLVLALGAVFSGSLFANGYIKPTFGFGFASSDGESSAGGLFGVDFVHPIGLTLGLQHFAAFDALDFGIAKLGYTFTPIGVGYTYDAGIWSVTGKVMVISDIFGDGLGFDVNGSYWIWNDLGLTGMFSLYFLDEALFVIGFGVSLKL